MNTETNSSDAGAELCDICRGDGQLCKRCGYPYLATKWCKCQQEPRISYACEHCDGTGMQKSEAQYEEEFRVANELQEKLGIKEFSLSLPLQGDSLKAGKIYKIKVQSIFGNINTHNGPMTYHELLKLIDEYYQEHMEHIHMNCHGTKDEKVCEWSEEFQENLPCCGEDHRYLEIVNIDHKNCKIEVHFGS